MTALIDISGHWIDPERVVSIGKPGGETGKLEDWFFIHVDMGSWVASYKIPEDEEFGWTVDTAAKAVNAGRQNS